MDNLENKAFHIVIITGKNIDGKRILDKILSYSTLGFKKFIIHVLTSEERPLYLEKMRNVIFKNIAFTLMVKHHKLARESLNELLNSLKNKPYEIIET